MTGPDVRQKFVKQVTIATIPKVMMWIDDRQLGL